MPRQKSTFVPKYRKHRGSGQAIVTFSGKDHYLGPYGTKASKLEYDRLIGEWLVGGRYSLVASDEGITIVELCIRYWKWAQGYYRKHDRDTGVTAGIKSALKYLRDHYGHTLATDFGP